MNHPYFFVQPTSYFANGVWFLTVEIFWHAKNALKSVKNDREKIKYQYPSAYFQWVLLGLR